ncbi:MAG: DUF3137 domain-containing protein [Acetobacter sp.]|nr:DUF3137 domain-containing protein [Acetobacter sp.]
MFKVNKELYALRERFRTFYNANLKKDYKELEAYRKKYLIQFYIRIILSVFIGCILLWTTNIYLLETHSQIYHLTFGSKTTDSNDIISYLWYIYIVTAFIACRQPFKDYKTNTKNMVMNKILSFFGTLKHGDGIGSKITAFDLKNALVFEKFDEFDEDDTFTGTYNNTNIAVTEYTLSRNFNLLSNIPSTYTTFKGVTIMLDFKQHYIGQTIVQEKKNPLSHYFKNKYFNIIAFLLSWFISGPILEQLKKYITVCVSSETPLQIFIIIFCTCLIIWLYTKYDEYQYPQDNNSLQQINLEDIVFKKRWKTHSNDQIGARVLLTPALMERMLEIKRRFYGRAIDFAFWDNKCLIAIHTNKDMFETTSLFTPALSYYKVQEVITQFYSIFSTIDLLNNSNKLLTQTT